MSIKKRILSNKSKNNVKVSKEDVLNKMISIFEKYKNSMKGCFLYGSTSRNTHTKTSDIDILIIWNKFVSINIATQFKNELEKTFLKNIDLVCMIHRNKIIYNFNDISTQNEVFIENVYRDAIPIFGNKRDILFSENVGKI